MGSCPEHERKGIKKCMTNDGLELVDTNYRTYYKYANNSTQSK